MYHMLGIFKVYKFLWILWYASYPQNFTPQQLAYLANPTTIVTIIRVESLNFNGFLKIISVLPCIYFCKSKLHLLSMRAKLSEFDINVFIDIEDFFAGLAKVSH